MSAQRHHHFCIKLLPAYSASIHKHTDWNSYLQDCSPVLVIRQNWLSPQFSLLVLYWCLKFPSTDISYLLETCKHLFCSQQARQQAQVWLLRSKPPTLPWNWISVFQTASVWTSEGPWQRMTAPCSSFHASPLHYKPPPGLPKPEPLQCNPHHQQVWVSQQLWAPKEPNLSCALLLSLFACIPAWGFHMHPHPAFCVALQLSCKPKDRVPGLISEISCLGAASKVPPGETETQGTWIAANTREQNASCSQAAHSGTVGEGHFTAITQLQSDLPNGEDKNLLNLQVTYSVRLPLTHSEEKRSETRVTAKYKYWNFYRLAKKFKKRAARIIPLLSFFCFKKLYKTFSMCSCTNLCIPAHTEELNSILLHT